MHYLRVRREAALVHHRQLRTRKETTLCSECCLWPIEPDSVICDVKKEFVFRNIADVYIRQPSIWWINNQRGSVLTINLGNFDREFIEVVISLVGNPTFLGRPPIGIKRSFFIYEDTVILYT